MTEQNNSETQKLRLLQYLPEIYREQGPGKDFLEGFLDIFAEVLQGFEKTTAGLPGFFDPLSAPENFLPFLAQWVALDLYELLGDKNREFILKAGEFYKQKGTAAGIESLVTFLTGKMCRVKEFTHNIFRTYSPASCQGQHPVKGDEVMSRTVDWSDQEVRSKFGTYYDGLHYVYDSSDTGLYNRNVIGLYVFLRTEEKEFIIEPDQLHKIIRSFLPVFVRAEIILELEDYDTFPLDKVLDASKVWVQGSLTEAIRAVSGTYLDTVTWVRFISNQKIIVSNDLLYRTKHEDIDVDKEI